MSRTRYFTTAEAAEVLGLTQSRVVKLCQAERLGRKIGRNWAISQAQLDKFAAIPRKAGWPAGKPRGARPKPRPEETTDDA